MKDKKIVVRLNENIFSNGCIKIISSIGQEIRNVQINNTITEIELGNNRAGIYFITVETKDAIVTRKIYLK